MCTRNVDVGLSFNHVFPTPWSSALASRCRLLITLNTYLCYVRTQSVPRCKHCMSVIKTKLIMLYKAKVAVCSENTQTEGNHHVEFFNVKPVGT